MWKLVQLDLSSETFPSLPTTLLRTNLRRMRLTERYLKEQRMQRKSKHIRKKEPLCKLNSFKQVFFKSNQIKSNDTWILDFRTHNLCLSLSLALLTSRHTSGSWLLSSCLDDDKHSLLGAAWTSVKVTKCRGWSHSYLIISLPRLLSQIQMSSVWQKVVCRIRHPLILKIVNYRYYHGLAQQKSRRP